jgi:hypothetical protein
MTVDDKAEILTVLQQAKMDYLEWHANAERLICGLETAAEVPLGHEECKFGRWCLRQGKALFNHRDAFILVRNAHQTMHLVYQNIHELVNAGRRKEAEMHLPELVAASGVLADALDMLAREVGNMN